MGGHGQAQKPNITVEASSPFRVEAGKKWFGFIPTLYLSHWKKTILNGVWEEMTRTVVHFDIDTTADSTTAIFCAATRLQPQEKKLFGRL